MNIFGCSSKKNCETMDGEVGRAETILDGWLIMSPFQEDGGCFFQRKTWKRRWFVLTLVHVRNTNVPNHYHLRYYTKENGRSPNGSVDLNTVTNIHDQPQPTQQMLERLRLRDSDQEDDLQAYCERLPMFSFEAVWLGAGRQQVFLLAASARAMQSWVQRLRSACGFDDHPGPEIQDIAADQRRLTPVQPITPLLPPVIHPYGPERQHRPSSPANQLPPPEKSRVDKPDADDGHYGDIKTLCPSRRKHSPAKLHHGDPTAEDDEIYRVPRTEGDEEEGLYASNVVPPGEFTDTEDAYGLPGVEEQPASRASVVVPPPRRLHSGFQQQQLPDRPDRGSSSSSSKQSQHQQAARETDYENLAKVTRDLQQRRQSELDSPDHVYGNLY